MTALDDGAEVLAKSLRPKHPPHAHGWRGLVGPCRDALLDLVSDGWTPPGEPDESENDRLREEITRQARRLEDLGRRVDQLTTEERAFGEIRGLLVQLAHPCGRDLLGLEPDRTYTAAEVQAWLVRLLDTADKRAEAVRRQSARLGEERAARTERAQAALFEPAAAVRDIERVPSAVAQAVGL